MTSKTNVETDHKSTTSHSYSSYGSSRRSVLCRKAQSFHVYRRLFIRQVVVVVVLSIFLDLTTIIFTFVHLGFFRKPCKEGWSVLKDHRDHSTCRRRVCYYTGTLALDVGFTPEDLNASLCTHIHYAYLTINNNKLQFFSPGLELNCSYPNQEIFSRINKLKRQHNGLKTIASVGGSDLSQVLSQMVNTHESRQQFADNSVQFLRRHDFDGLEMYWMYPGKGSPSSDREKFTLLLRQLRSTFDNYSVHSRPALSPLLLTAAIALGNRSRIENAYEVEKIHPLLDYMSLLTFDFHGRWMDSVSGHSSPLYSRNNDNASLDWAARYFSQERGVPSKKMVLGIPTYGRSFDLLNKSVNAVGSPTDFRPGIPQKLDILEAYFLTCAEHPGEIRNRSEDQRVPYVVVGNKWTSYEDIQSVKEKAEYVMKNGYGGVAIWAPPLDDFRNDCGQGHFPLTTAINDVICPNSTPVDTGDDKLEKILSLAEKVKTTRCSPVNPVCQRRVCTYVSEAVLRTEGKMYPEDVNVSLCTHLLFHGVGLQDSRPQILHNSSSLFAQVQKLKKDCRHLQILLTVGGTGVSNEAFAQMTSTSANRSQFITEAISLVKQHQFDGLDVLSWSMEELNNTVDKENYTLLLQELREATNRDRLMLTATVRAAPEYDVNSAYEVDKIHRYVDFLNLMTFDFYAATGTKLVAHHSPLYSCDRRSVEGSAELWVSKGAPKSKLVLGISTNARVLKLEDEDKYDPGDTASLSNERGPYSPPGSKPAYQTYFGICLGQWLLGRLTSNEVPFLLAKDKWISFDDVESVTAKACYARTNGYGGVLAWTLADDDFKGQFCGQGRYPLWSAVSEVCLNRPT